MMYRHYETNELVTVMAISTDETTGGKSVVYQNVRTLEVKHMPYYQFFELVKLENGRWEERFKYIGDKT